MTDLSQRDRRSLSDQVADALVDLIHERGIKAGESIPSTAELAQMYGVSRPVVREAIADLSARGILKRTQGRESVVDLPGGRELERVLDFRVRHDELDVLAIQELRETLEVRTAELAARRRSPDQLQAIREAFEALANAKTEPQRRDADVRFHRHIANASGNDLFPLIIDAVDPLLRDSLERARPGLRASGETMEGLIGAHRRILRAIEAGDPAKAADAMRKHLQQTRRGLETTI